MPVLGWHTFASALAAGGRPFRNPDTSAWKKARKAKARELTARRMAEIAAAKAKSAEAAAHDKPVN